MKRKNQLYYEQILIGDVKTQKKRRLEARLTVEDKITLDHMKQENQVVLEKYPPDYVAGLIKTRLASLAKPPANPWSVLLKIGAPVAACLMAVIFVISLIIPPPSQDIRLKGNRPLLFIYKKTADGGEVLQDFARVKAGDSLQLSYKAGNKKFGAIISIDGRNMITKHYPLTGEGPSELELIEEILLPYSYQLDDAPDFEVFLFITSDKSFSLPIIIARLKRALRKGVKPEELKKAFMKNPEIDATILLKGDE